MNPDKGGGKPSVPEGSASTEGCKKIAEVKSAKRHKKCEPMFRLAGSLEDEAVRSQIINLLADFDSAVKDYFKAKKNATSIPDKVVVLEGHVEILIKEIDRMLLKIGSSQDVEFLNQIKERANALLQEIRNLATRQRDF